MKVDKDFISTFKDHFRNTHGHISHNLSDMDIRMFLELKMTQCPNDEVLTAMRLRWLADHFADYVLSQGIAEVQE